jgi:hypothetical protein
MGNGRTDACNPDFFRVSISLKVSGCTNSPPSTIRSFVAPVSSRGILSGHVLFKAHWAYLALRVAEEAQLREFCPPGSHKSTQKAVQ